METGGSELCVRVHRLLSNRVLLLSRCQHDNSGHRHGKPVSSTSNIAGSKLSSLAKIIATMEQPNLDVHELLRNDSYEIEYNMLIGP